MILKFNNNNSTIKLNYVNFILKLTEKLGPSKISPYKMFSCFLFIFTFFAPNSFEAILLGCPQPIEIAFRTAPCIIRTPFWIYESIHCSGSLPDRGTSVFCLSRWPMKLCTLQWFVVICYVVEVLLRPSAFSIEVKLQLDFSHRVNFDGADGNVGRVLPVFRLHEYIVVALHFPSRLCMNYDEVVYQRFHPMS